MLTGIVWGLDALVWQALRKGAAAGRQVRPDS